MFTRPFIIKLLAFIAAPLFLSTTARSTTAPGSYEITSPDKKLSVNILLGENISYTITRSGQPLLDKSVIDMTIDGKSLGTSAKVLKFKKQAGHETIRSPFYRTASFSVDYNEINLLIKGGHGVIFRVFNEGVAYRFYSTQNKEIIVNNETALLDFPSDYETYMAYSTSQKGRDPYAMAFQNLYTKAKLSATDSNNIAFLPITVDCEKGLKMTLLESDLEDYPGMFIAPGGATSLKASFAPCPSKMASRPPRSMTYVESRHDYIAKTKGNRNFPWRIWAITADDREMPVNNLVYALAAPNRIGDYSWVKTGKVAWDWWNNWGIYNVNFKTGINTETYKHYIDFAAENNIAFVVLDEGWYRPSGGDMLTVVPDIDLKALVQYGKSKGVDLILWTVFNVLDNQLEAACKKYSKMGISGFKVDFLDRDDQTAVQMAYRIAEMTARYKLSLDLHGFYKPTGINRTYPNIINVEAVFGMEEMKWSSIEKNMMQYDVTMPFIRMMCGFVDYTPGAMRNATKETFKPIYNNPFSQGTRCHQLAAYIVHDSPLTMLADNPTIYRKEQECTSFICSIPNTGIETTRILQGTLGNYIVTARKVKQNWYVGAMTNWTARDIDLNFDFLEPGSYKVTLFKDGINADKQAEDYQKLIFDADPHTTKNIHLAPGGGFAMAIERK